jgi:hypothetical protein
MIVGCSPRRPRRPAPLTGLGPAVGQFKEVLITECERLTAERRQIAAVLAELPGTVGELRAALNRLAAIVG